MDFLKHFLTAGLIFVIIDSVWISVVADKFYKANIGYLLAKKANLVPAVIFYIIYIIAMVVFVINVGLERGTTGSVILHGALLGFAMYATYDLTNHATIKNWPLKMTLVDMAWGTSVTTAVTTITFLIFK
jgi:uncharacterized membrane protein